MASSQAAPPSSSRASRKRSRFGIAIPENQQHSPQLPPAKSSTIAVLGHLLSLVQPNALVDLPRALSRYTGIFQSGLIPEALRMLTSPVDVGEMLVQKIQETLLRKVHEMTATEVGASERIGHEEPGTDAPRNVQLQNAAAVTTSEERQSALSCSMAVSAPSSQGDEEMEEVPSVISSEWGAETMDWEAERHSTFPEVPYQEHQNR